MIHNLKPYPAYKDSGVPWLGEVPEHWRFDRAKWLFQKMNRPVKSDDDVVTCFRDGIVTLRKNRRVTGFTESLKEIGYQGVRRGDLVIHAMDAFAGAIGVSDSDGKCTPVYSVCQHIGDINSNYYSYIVREMARSQWIVALAKGIRERSTDFRFEGFASQNVPIPQRQEQDRIATFIDNTDRRIRRYIHAKQKLIKLLEEQKQVIIHKAVTRGLDPNVKLKLSGVEWLGDVPEHWDVLRSRYIFHEVDERSTTGEEQHLSMSQKYGLIRSDQIEEHRLISESYIGAKICESGYLVLNRLKAHLGVFALASELGLVSPDYTVFRPIRDVVPSYFEFVYRTPACRIELRQRAKGIVQGFWRLYTDDFYQIPVPVPHKQEQESIVTAIEEKIRQIKETITQTEIEISLISEYRTRLIADVVTGKLDVREAASNLPEEIEETVVLEDELTEDEETAEEDLKSEPEVE